MEDTAALAEFLRTFYHEGIYVIEEPGSEQSTSPVQDVTSKIKTPTYKQPAPSGSNMVKEPGAALTAGNETGGYSQHILILVDYSKDNIIGRDDLQFLEKILRAIKLALKDVLITNVHGFEPLDFERLFRKRGPNKVLAFGVYAGDCGHGECALYEMAHIGGTTWLFADDLHGIDSDVARKKAFWKVLQEMFL